MKAAAIRVFVDAHVFDDTYQGTRTFIKEIYKILCQKENIELYLGANDIENLRNIFGDRKNIVFIKYRSTSGIIRLLYDIPSIIRKYKIEYAHFQYIIPVIKNCKFIVTIHDVIFNEYPNEFSIKYRISKNLLFKISALRADIITTVSEYSRKSIGKYLGVSANNVQVVRNGVNEIFFKEYDKNAAQQYIFSKYRIKKFILYVSRIEPRKNHIALLKSFLELKLYEAGYHLVLLGYESIKVPEFDELMANLPVAARPFVFLSSKVGDDDLLNFYKAAAFFVYPSKAEGFGIPPLEAAALKIPVICSNVSAMSDFTFFGEYHIDPSDYRTLKSKMLKIINESPSEAFLNDVAMTISKQYSWAESADTLYNALVNN